MFTEGDCESNHLPPTESRNSRFDSDQPFHDDPSLSLVGATGAFRFLNPTSALYSWTGWKPSDHHREQRALTEDEREREGLLPARHKDEALGFVWRSRDNRKGRHALALRLGDDGRKQSYGTLKPTNSPSATLRGIYAIFTNFPYWDLSWIIAAVYTFGSFVWVANGSVSLVTSGQKAPAEGLTLANTWIAFAGASIFYLGSYLLFLEAVNANRSGCFGWAVKRNVTDGRSEAQVKPGDCEHHCHEQHRHPEQDHIHGDSHHESQIRHGHAGDMGHTETAEETNGDSSYEWVWWPTWRDLRTRLFYELGFIASAIQLASGSLFFLCRFSTLPGITEYLSQTALDGANWAPQILGCVGFIGASWLFMLETQSRWYVPAPRVLGWHVGFWKLVGCTGFLLSAVFSPLGQHGLQFAGRQSSISALWGSCLVLLGSLVQMYESLEKHPIIQEGTGWWSEWNEKYIQESSG